MNSPMTRASLQRTAAYVALLGLLAGCTVTPQLVTKDEVATRVKEDTSRMYVNQEAIAGTVTLEVAVARTLKYNLDYRLKQMESALALGITDYSRFEMWPKLLLNAGYSTRSNDSGGTSVGIQDGIVSLRPSTSQTRDYAQAGAEFSWNVLDFGVSYYRAKQNANQYLIAEERRRKLVQNMIQDVRAAYWRALGAQRLAQDAKTTLARADVALTRSREAETQKIISPALALNYQRALLDATSLLNQRRQDLDFAKHELAALMSVPPGTQFDLAESVEVKLPPVPGNVLALEEMALLQRPELREEDFKKRITADETRKQYLNVLPNFNLNAGLSYNSNDFLYNKNWQQASVGVTWNILRLFSLPDLEKTQAEQVKVDEARRTALSMAIITQLRVSVERYRLAVEDHKLAEQAASVDRRLADYTQASVSAKLENELEAIRTQARAVLGAYQKANAYANAQIAFGRLYNTLGFDPLQDDFDGNSVTQLADRIRQHLKEESAEPLKLKSNLFGDSTRVAIQINGVENALLKERMKQELVALLARNDITHDDAHGQPLTFSLKRDTTLAIDRAGWSIRLLDKAGKASESADFTTKIPEQSRDSVVEATLIAAATSHLTTMKSWLTRQEDLARNAAESDKEATRP
jgi:outer membrane protein TolC